jgi:hypothetical protein
MMYVLPLEGGCNEKSDYRPMVCTRQMPEYPVVVYAGRSATEKTYYTVIQRLEKPYAKARLKTKSSCMRCPHRKMLLNGVPNDGETVVCPGHGLRWNLKTGGLVKREGEVEGADSRLSKAMAKHQPQSPSWNHADEELGGIYSEMRGSR